MCFSYPLTLPMKIIYTPLMKVAPTSLLYSLILLEGYCVLAAELLAIRQTVPYVGSGTDTVAIIIAAVLMPLAAGYHAGGQFLRTGSVRTRILRNLWIAGLILLLGLSTWTIALYFVALVGAGIYHRLILVALYALTFLVTPVYLLGQTVPLLSNYFSKDRLSQLTGRMLAISTLGSFLGATLTTLVLMSVLGVNHTVTIMLALLALCAVLLGGSRKRKAGVILSLLVALSLLLNSDAALRSLGIVSTNQYNTIAVTTHDDGSVHFLQNNTDSSALYANGKRHPYIEAAEAMTITPLQDKALPPKDILVIGAGGFSFGLYDERNIYTYVDIDPALEKVAVREFLKVPLGKNKTFVPVAIQGHLLGNSHDYDLIFLDVFNGDITLPEDLVTREFFQSLKDHIKPDGMIVINFIVTPAFIDPLSRNLDNTLHAVFPHLTRQLVGPVNAWDRDLNSRTNALYLYRKGDPADEQTRPIYTQDKNSVFLDKPQSRP